jgi:hypothetical protein
VVNANAAGLSEDQIQSGLRGALVLQIQADNDLGPVELNCGALIYCSRGGTGRHDLHLPNGLTLNPEPFPECCDPDGDGFGSLLYGSDFDVGRDPGAAPGLFLQPRASADQIRGGDLLIGLAEVPPWSKDTPGKLEPYAGQEVEVPFTMRTIFATPPALASYTDELGATHAVSYPYSNAALPVVDGPDPDSDVSVELSFWRPQRRPVPDEVSSGAGNWVDIGGLEYWVRPALHNCPQSAFSTTDPALSLTSVTRQSPTGPEEVGLLVDSAPDRPATPTNTFSYTLNLTSCLAAAGAPEDVEAFNSGSTSVQAGFVASPVPTEGQPPAEQLIASTFFFLNQP